ncbi:MAG: 3-dehydroquinate synthase family protein [Planctomycetota bacterium]
MIDLYCRPPHEPSTHVRIGSGSLSSLERETAGRTVFALADARVADRHPTLLASSWHVLRVESGESLKTLAMAEVVLRAMAVAGIDRKGLLLALGGGTVGDLGGLCAALWLRGIECWQVPTTMMAMVDSAIGGKTAVNLPEGKNLVGVVHPPTRVFVDPTLLEQLPDTEFKSGLAEAQKVAIGLDRELFAFLEQNGAAIRARRPEALAEVIHRALQAKATVVESDLREDGPRRLLNLGHTLGHALEAHGDFREPHGLCVARGLHFALDVAESLRAMTATDLDRCRNLLVQFGHLRTPLPTASTLMPFVLRDKKVEAGQVHFVVPTGIGESRVQRLRADQIAAVLERR